MGAHPRLGVGRELAMLFLLQIRGVDVPRWYRELRVLESVRGEAILTPGQRMDRRRSRSSDTVHLGQALLSLGNVSSTYL